MTLRTSSATRLSVVDQHVLSRRVRHAEPIAPQMKLANARVTHVDSASAVTDIRTRPQLTETVACGRQLVDQRPQPRIIPIARGDLPQPAHHISVATSQLT